MPDGQRRLRTFPGLAANGLREVYFPRISLASGDPVNKVILCAVAVSTISASIVMAAPVASASATLPKPVLLVNGSSSAVSVPAGSAVTFDASRSKAPKGTHLTKATLNDGDGGIKGFSGSPSGWKTSDVYPKAGTFTASLRVTDSARKSATVKISITVTPPSGGSQCPATFTSQTVPTVPGTHNRGGLQYVTAVDSSHAWAAGTVDEFDPSGGGVPISGVVGVLDSYDGTSWHAATLPQGVDLTGAAMYGLTSTSVSDVWALGASNALSGQSALLLLHYDGTSWQQLSSPSFDNFSGFAIAAVSPTSVYIGGLDVDGNPAVLHGDGSTWSEQVLPGGLPFAEINDMTVAGSTVWAVGGGGNQPGQTTYSNVPLVYELDASGWHGVDFATQDDMLFAVSGLSGSDVWVTGQDSNGNEDVAYHYTGTSWQPLTESGRELTSVSERSPTSVWFADFLNSPPFGSNVDRYDGSSFTTAASFQGATVAGVSAQLPKEVFAVGHSADSSGNAQPFVVHSCS
jgi:hypothetical protein